MKRLLLSALIGAGILIGIAAAAEWHWRARGYTPNLIDSSDLWSQQRARLAALGSRAVALIGASRTLYSVDLKTFRQQAPEHEPVMLAVDANPAMATLRDLANDPDFIGIVLCDIDTLGLWQPTWDLQQPLVDHYRNEWTPARDAHRSLLSLWQQHAVIARSDFSLVRTAVRILNHENEPFHPHSWMNTAREGFIDFSKTDPSQHRVELQAHLDRYGGHLPGPTPTEWLSALTPVRDWVQRIQQRGGQVIFYATPISGLRRWVDEDTYPRARYWDQLSAATGAKTLHADDIPALANFPLPDESHIDYHDKQRYTEILVQALRARNLL